jgi:hypothetical protein
LYIRHLKWRECIPKVRIREPVVLVRRNVRSHCLWVCNWFQAERASLLYIRVVGDTQACLIASHLKGAKVEAAGRAWYITTALRGKAGSRAALADKFIERTAVPKEFEATFDSDSREAK